MRRSDSPLRHGNRLRGRCLSLAFATLWLCSGASAETLYVSDRILAALYPTARLAGAPVEQLPTGTTLTPLERRGDLLRVRTGSGSEGWLMTAQVQEEMPAQLLLISLAEQHERTVTELDDLRRQLAVRANEENNNVSRSWWTFFAVVVSLAAGFVSGAAWLDHRVRERHGGFRI